MKGSHGKKDKNDAGVNEPLEVGYEVKTSDVLANTYVTPFEKDITQTTEGVAVVNDFKFANWSSPHGPSVYCVTAQCKGHHAFDLTPSRTLYERSDGSYVYEYLTNHEVLKMTHPREYQMPYIYDNFRWDHCEEEGYMFPGAPATEDTTFDASSSPRNASSPPPGGYSP